MRNCWWILALAACDDGGNEAAYAANASSDAAVDIAANASGDGAVNGDEDAVANGDDDAAINPEPDAAAPVQPNPPTGCAQDVECGGDPSGVWHWVAWCRVDDEGPIDGCPGSERSTTITPEGTVELGAEGMFAVRASYLLNATARLPKACFAGVSCDDLGAQLDEDQPWTCVEDGDACDCEREQVLDGDTEGTWSVEDAMLTIDDAEGIRPFHFCVEGDSLHLLDVDADGDEPVFVLQR